MNNYLIIITCTVERRLSGQVGTEANSDNGKSGQLDNPKKWLRQCFGSKLPFTLYPCLGLAIVEMLILAYITNGAFRSIFFEKICAVIYI